MFLLEGGELLLNEVAPRPHNSGHYTIEATSISQFEQHLRAILGWPLADVLPLAGARWDISWKASQHASYWPDRSRQGRSSASTACLVTQQVLPRTRQRSSRVLACEWKYVMELAFGCQCCQGLTTHGLPVGCHVLAVHGVACWLLH